MRWLILASALATTALQAAEHPNAPSPIDDEFHFVVLGDAQFDAPEVFNRIIDQTSRLRPAFVIQVGDLIEGYNSDLATIRSEWTRFRKQIAPLGDIAYLPVPGNHDLYGSNKQPDQTLTDLFAEVWGASHFDFTYRNTLIVGVNSDVPGAPNQITGQQWQWLARTLSASDVTHKMVFMHRPPWLMENADDVHELFKRNKVSHVIYGHHHHYHHLMRDGVAYTMTNAAGDSVHHRADIGGMPHLLHISVHGDDVRVAPIIADAILPVDAVVPQDNYDYFNLSRGLAPKEVSLKALDSGGYQMPIPLTNTTQRDIQVLISCFSGDDRWQFEPRRIEPVTLAPRATQSIDLVVSFAPDREPESDPSCQLKVPVQTAQGQWIEFNHTVAGKR